MTRRPGERAEFLRALIGGSADPDSPLVVALVMPRETTTATAPSTGARRTLAANHVLVGPMTATSSGARSSRRDAGGDSLSNRRWRTRWWTRPPASLVRCHWCQPHWSRRGDAAQVTGCI